MTAAVEHCWIIAETLTIVHGWRQPGGPGTRWVLHRDIDIS